FFSSRRRHTRWPRDWSSDVCSSDLFASVSCADFFVKKSAHETEANLKCVVSGTLILRYLERIADHATYVGETVPYIVSGERAARSEERRVGKECECGWLTSD